MILLYNRQIEHFTQLYYNSNYIIERNKKAEKVIPIPNIQDEANKYNITTNSLELDIKNLIKKYLNLSLNEKFKNNVICNNNILTFEEKLKKGYYYPCYPNEEHEINMLLNIREYLMQRRKNILKPKYSKYINNKNEDNLKRYFRNKANRYDIDNENNLYIKYYDNK